MLVRIAFVMDDLGVHSNGTSVTARRYARALRAQGHEVRLVGAGAEGEDSFCVAERHIPVVTPIATACGFHFGAPDETVFARAFDGVDLMHLFLPFALEQSALAWARRNRIAVSAAFHLQPENVTYNAGIGAAPPVCDLIYGLFRRWLYDGVRHVHCPSEMIAGRLAEHGYRAQTTVISNGVPDPFVPADAPAPIEGSDGLIHVVTVGRLAPEKNQATILRAVGLSRHRDRIKLHVCGSGPRRRALERLGSRLPVAPSFEFHDTAGLVALEQKSPFYVHASVADIEAISVLEALACGCVPVIGQAPQSAPAAFALTEQSLFPARDAQALADRLDWWIDHPQERIAWSARYVAEGERLRVARCCERFAAFAEKAVSDDAACDFAAPSGGAQ